jgi:hypothetical protein
LTVALAVCCGHLLWPSASSPVPPPPHACADVDWGRDRGSACPGVSPGGGHALLPCVWLQPTHPAVRGPGWSPCCGRRCVASRPCGAAASPRCTCPHSPPPPLNPYLSLPPLTPIPTPPTPTPAYVHIHCSLCVGGCVPMLGEPRCRHWLVAIGLWLGIRPWPFHQHSASTVSYPILACVCVCVWTRSLALRTPSSPPLRPLLSVFAS